MKEKIKNIISFITKKITPADLIILNYHQVTPRYNPQLHSPGTWTQTDKFEKELLYLKKNFNIISLKDIVENKKVKKNSIVITFDDGIKSIEKYAIPILEKHNVPASFFINTSYFDTNKASWATIGNYLLFSKDLKNKLPKNYINIKNELRNTNNSEIYSKKRQEVEKLYIHLPKDFRFFTNLDFLKSLNTKLFTVGLHGHEHQRHSMLIDKQQELNIIKNIEILSNLPSYIPIFAIPYGKPYDWNKETENICKKNNLLMMSAFGGQNINAERTGMLNRIPSDSESVKEIINYSYFKRIKK